MRVELTGTRGLRENHDLEVTLDGEPVKLVTLGPQRDGAPNSMYAQASTVDFRMPVAAGPREVGVTFFKKPSALVEQVREPFPNPRVAGNPGGLAGQQPFVRSVTITGPYGGSGVTETPSRERIFTCRPADTAAETACAHEILSGLARRAYRRPVTAGEMQVLLDFYSQGRRDGSFEDGVELAIRRLLVSPEFLYRIESDPVRAAPGKPYRVPDLELASRLSFFLWSSIPDDELLDAAEQGRLSDPAELERQVRRMVADPRSATLTTNFAAQWLQLRNLETTVRPGDPFSVAFDESLRQSMLRETELFVDRIVRDDRGMVELLVADYTFLNERLAEHYGIPGVTGSHFRRVDLPADGNRRGILGHGSILTLTSHAIRTSPVLRGKWILDNLLGTPPPDPPPNIPALNDQRTQARRPTVRARMEAHRNNPACSACHSMIDPTGFALENFDAIGRWRVVDESFNTIDRVGRAAGRDGPFEGVDGHDRRALVRQRPEQLRHHGDGKAADLRARPRAWRHYDMPAVQAHRERGGGRRLPVPDHRREYREQLSVPLSARSRYGCGHGRGGGPLKRADNRDRYQEDTLSRGARCSAGSARQLPCRFSTPWSPALTAVARRR